MPKLKTKPPVHDTLTGYDFRVDPPLGTRKAIRAKCLECCCGQAAEVRRCHIYDCTLWYWRMGRRATPSELTLVSKNSDMLQDSEETDESGIQGGQNQKPQHMEVFGPGAGS